MSVPRLQGFIDPEISPLMGGGSADSKAAKTWQLQLSAVTYSTCVNACSRGKQFQRALEIFVEADVTNIAPWLMAVLAFAARVSSVGMVHHWLYFHGMWYDFGRNQAGCVAESQVLYNTAISTSVRALNWPLGLSCSDSGSWEACDTWVLRWDPWDMCFFFLRLAEFDSAR